MAEWYWQEHIEMLGEKYVAVTLGSNHKSPTECSGHEREIWWWLSGDQLPEPCYGIVQYK